MAVDLFDLVDPLKRSVNPPGTNLFPDATDDEFVGYLSDAFWEIRMLEMLTNYTEADGSITPISGTDDLPRQLQQLLVLFGAIKIVTMELINIDTTFRAKAGPVEFETGKNGNLLRDVLAELQRQRAIVERQLFSIGAITDYYFDSIVSRTDSILYNGPWIEGWTR